MNIGSMMKIQSALKKFNEDHPRVMLFFRAVETAGIKEGTVIEMTVKTPEGQSMTSNIKVQQSDIELFESLKSIRE